MQPVIVGGGLPLFAHGEKRTKLELRSSKTFALGRHRRSLRDEALSPCSRIMISLQGDAPVDTISAYLAAQGVNVLGVRELADEGATIIEVGDAPAVVEHERSALRALWIVDVHVARGSRRAREECARR